MHTSLTKSRSVLSIVGPGEQDDAAYVSFDYDHGNAPDDDGLRRRLTLDANTWQEMGSPAMVTITIKPGDRLNRAEG